MFLFELGHCETTALQEALVEFRRHLNISGDVGEFIASLTPKYSRNPSSSSLSLSSP